ncbi:MAG TPA: hypothetical protein VMA72_26170 [Streptosporangiaceae bacterium]|nr:hypothetical protein [Streptosporangiaceae bacterium]
MNHTPGAADTTQGGGFDPRQAAALLDQATQQARRAFTPLTPPLFSFRAVVVLVVFGGFWLSVRGQHPYTGHINGWAIAVAVVLVAINIGWTARVIGRAGTGVSGPAQRKWGAWKGIMVAAWIIGYAVTAPLYHAAVSHPVWGLYPASAPLLIIGLAAAVVAAAFRYWPLAGTLLAIGVVAAAAGFAGPAGSWLIVGIGLCAVYLGIAAFTAWRRHRSMVRP